LTSATLATFDGPNRFNPRPGVLANLCVGRDYSLALRAALKDAAQRIGLVIGAPRIDNGVTNGEVWHEAFFVMPLPARDARPTGGKAHLHGANVARAG
jgi:hypothetical protein